MVVKMVPPMRALSPRTVIIGGCLLFVVAFFWMSNRIDMDSIRSAVPSSPFNGGGAVRSSRLHYLIPASQATLPFCASVVSSLVTRYSIPTMIGYKGKGEFDAKAAHIAKLRVLKRYLHGPAGENEDDLVMVMDGYDVLSQLPADVMIERYFELMASADQRLADRYGITVEEAHERDLRQTILWGADKGCFPPLMDDPQCWAVPESHLAHNVWGSKTGDGTGVHYTDPIFLNSGTVIGPLGDLRLFIDRVLQKIEKEWTKDFKYRNSDQYWCSKVYARQEIERTKNITGGYFPGVTGNRKMPPPKNGTEDRTEYHVGVDAESSFAMTQCWNDQWMRRYKYENPDNTVTVKEDVFDSQARFREYRLQLPNTIFQSLRRIHGSLLDERPALNASEWVRTLGLHTNVATKVIFAFYHNTCSKKHFVDKFKTYWYWPLVKPLLRAAMRATVAEEPISDKLIDGRMWYPANSWPSNATFAQELGGVFTDFKNESERFVPFSKLCGEHYRTLFDDEEPAPKEPEHQDPPKEPPKEPEHQDPPKEPEHQESPPKEPEHQDPPKEPEHQEAPPEEPPKEPENQETQPKEPENQESKPNEPENQDLKDENSAIQEPDNQESDAKKPDNQETGDENPDSKEPENNDSKNQDSEHQEPAPSETAPSKTAPSETALSETALSETALSETALSETAPSEPEHKESAPSEPEHKETEAEKTETQEEKQESEQAFEDLESEDIASENPESEPKKPENQEPDSLESEPKEPETQDPERKD